MTINDLFQRSDFLIIGHRGAAGLAPENTIASFRLAIELGCPMLELDVQRIYSEDGTPRLVVFHDDKLDRTTNAKGLITDYSVEALEKVRCADDLAIPMLEDVITLLAVHPNVGLNIELKSKATADLVAQTIQANPHIPVLVRGTEKIEGEVTPSVIRGLRGATQSTADTNRNSCRNASRT